MNKVRLGDICNISSGGTPSRSKHEYWENGTIPWVKISDFKDKYIKATEERITPLALENSSAKLLHKGCILFSIFATIGEVSILDIDAATNQAIASLELKSDLISIEYLYCFLTSLKSQVSRMGRGVAQNNINLSILKNIEIIIPEKKIQTDITKRLETLDYMIALSNIHLRKLDELIKSRFVEMFGDVVHNTKNWDKHIFSDIATSRLGKMLDTKKQIGEFSFPYLANFNVQWFEFNLSSLNQMDFDEKDQAEFALKEGDLLVCEGGEIGRCAIWHNEISPCYFQKALHRVRCNQDIILPMYLAWWFKFNCENKGFSDIEGAKATISHLPGAKLKRLNVVVPPVELQQQFANFVEKVNKSKTTVQQCIDKLETLKKSLMQEYFG